MCVAVFDAVAMFVSYVYVCVSVSVFHSWDSSSSIRQPQLHLVLAASPAP